ncbi:MAG: hypothetical protein AAGD25_14840 [Cyanobacteria bacterium P01_F01_bin.150]
MENSKTSEISILRECIQSYADIPGPTYTLDALVSIIGRRGSQADECGIAHLRTQQAIASITTVSKAMRSPLLPLDGDRPLQPITQRHQPGARDPRVL